MWSRAGIGQCQAEVEQIKFHVLQLFCAEEPACLKFCFYIFLQSKFEKSKPGQAWTSIFLSELCETYVVKKNCIWDSVAMWPEATKALWIQLIQPPGAVAARNLLRRASLWHPTPSCMAVICCAPWCRIASKSWALHRRDAFSLAHNSSLVLLLVL